MSATPAQRHSRFDGSGGPMNVLVGAVVTVVLAPVLPLSALVGGGVASYLQNGSRTEGALVGALAPYVREQL